MKLLFVNGSRGEWGYIKPIIDACISRKHEYSICATNMLLLKTHGALVDSIINKGYNVTSAIYMALDGHDAFAMAKSLGVFLTSFVDHIKITNPDWIILAGDRGEQLMAAVAAAYSYIPVAHIQAGEKSGNIDGVARHAIGKLAHVHFAANTDAYNRLVNLGEEDFRIYEVGAPQLDDLWVESTLTIKELSSHLRLDLQDNYLMVVLHPVTEQATSSMGHLEQLVSALKTFNMQKIWIMPNNDAGAEAIIRNLPRMRTSDMHIYSNLSRNVYLSLLRNCSAIIGNSSSGLLEAPTFKTPCVNIGRRQQDRVQGPNVVNADFDATSIGAAIAYAIDPSFKLSLASSENPYGKGDSAGKILDILENLQNDARLLVKNLTL